ncbi:hypothetical protein NQZ68_042205 [Dissostichus eleginoides]|nr:hypothetical protein NQZ68_042205 [Dissostichus eleginoides]
MALDGFTKSPPGLPCCSPAECSHRVPQVCPAAVRLSAVTESPSPAECSHRVPQVCPATVRLSAVTESPRSALLQSG